MSAKVPPKSSLRKLQQGRRNQALRLSQADLVKMDPLHPDTLLPLMITPAVSDIDVIAWIQTNRDFIASQLLKHGGILFRGFHMRSLSQFENFVQAFSQDLLEYTYGFTPRSRAGGNIYTSTEHPSDQFIPPHNEKSYDATWPMKLWFCCLQAAEKGGETPIYDSRRIWSRLSPSIQQQFKEKKVMYMRNYSEQLDLPWQKVFQTNEKSEVEAYCGQHNISFEWLDGNRLRTRQVCQAVATHPKTGDTVWFNQAHLFHVSSLPTSIREVLLSSFAEEELPRNAYYGDGTAIELSVLEEIRGLYADEAVVFPWQEGDVVMVDNMLTAHARNPFEGPRQIVVAMAEPATAN